jgi:hypothetical protein
VAPWWAKIVSTSRAWREHEEEESSRMGESNQIVSSLYLREEGKEDVSGVWFKRVEMEIDEWNSHIIFTITFLTFMVLPVTKVTLSCRKGSVVPEDGVLDDRATVLSIIVRMSTTIGSKRCNILRELPHCRIFAIQQKRLFPVLSVVYRQLLLEQKCLR